MKDCVVCRRVPPKLVFDYAHKVFNTLQKDDVHKIAKEACEIINRVDKENRIFLCGKSYASILSGLFYILGLKSGNRVSQFKVAGCFPSRNRSEDYFDRFDNRQHFTEHAVGTSFRRWREMLFKMGYLKTELYELLSGCRR